MILSIENPEDYTKKQLELVNEFTKSQDTKSVYRNLLCYYTLIMKHQKAKLEKQSFRGSRVA